jgi:hypothetical protein
MERRRVIVDVTAEDGVGSDERGADDLDADFADSAS